MNYDDLHMAAELSQLEEQITELRVQNENLQRKLNKVQSLIGHWKGYCMQNGGQTWRLMGEVQDLIDGKPVFAGNEQL